MSSAIGCAGTLLVVLGGVIVIVAVMSMGSEDVTVPIALVGLLLAAGGMSYIRKVPLHRASPALGSGAQQTR